MDYNITGCNSEEFPSIVRALLKKRNISVFFEKRGAVVPNVERYDAVGVRPGKYFVIEFYNGSDIRVQGTAPSRIKISTNIVQERVFGLVEKIREFLGADLRMDSDEMTEKINRIAYL